MSGTTNLNSPYIQASQNQKEVTANAAFDRFDAAITATLTLDLAAGSASPTAEQVRAAVRVVATNVTTTGRSVTLPAVRRFLVLAADAGNTQAVSFVRGSTTLGLPAGATRFVYLDGSANGLDAVGAAAGTVSLAGLTDGPGAPSGNAKKGLVVNSSGTALEYVDRPYDLGIYVDGAPAANERLLSFVFTRAVTLPANFAGSQAKAGTASTGSPALAVAKNGSAIASIIFSASAIGTLPSVGATSFAAGDRVTLTAPATVDGTLKDIDVSLAFILA